MFQKSSPFPRLNSLLLAGSVIAASSGALQAAPYTAGDLLLGFVAGEGAGADQTLIVNLGPTSGFRDAFDSGANKLDFTNVGSRLAAQFGAGWHERANLYVSLFGAANSSVTASTLFNGDPARTVYTSQARGSAGTLGSADSGGWNVPSNTAMTDAAGAIISIAAGYTKATADAQAAALISTDAANTLDEYTRPVTSLSFGSFNGGVEQAFAAGSWGALGDAGAVEAALDLYRIQARNNVTGQYGTGVPIRQGVYKGTITISQTGSVSFIAKGVATTDGFSAWTAGKGLPAGVAADDDRDHDGIPLLTEYALDLNPLAADTLPAPVAVEGGVRLSFTKGTAASADTKITYQIETSSNPGGDWTVLGTAAGTATEISGVLPSGSPSGRLFGRLKITKAN